MDRLNQETVDPLQRRIALTLVFLLIGLGLLLTPLANTPLPPLPGYMTAFGSAMLVSNLLLAALLFSRGATERRAATLQLGTAYFFVGTIFVPLMASFPGGIGTGNLIGSTVSPVWLWSFWHAGFGLAILRYAHTQRRQARVARVHREVLGCLAIVALLAWLATRGLEYLPQLLSNGQTFFTGKHQLIPYSLLLIDAAALISLLRLRELRLEQMWLAVGMAAACFDVWLTFLGSDRFSLGWYIAKLGSLITTLAVLFSLFHDLTALYRRAAESNRLLADLANHDGLTQLANRRRFDEVIAAEWLRARRSGGALSLLMLDVDLFKRFNDRYGHLGGDECLRRVAALLVDCARRPADLPARYGGEEFAIILPDTDGAGALELAQTMRSRLATLNLPHEDGVRDRVTVSIGVASIGPHLQVVQDLLSSADAALYRAKTEGRDGICSAPEPGVAQPRVDWQLGASAA